MELNVSSIEAIQPIEVEKVAGFIAAIQKDSGEIPWSQGGKTDPWDHVESAMGLSIAGYWVQAERAYEWLASTQLADGSWWSETQDGRIINSTKETNYAAYIAVGVYQHFLITGHLDFLKSMWPSVSRGIQYAIGMQAPEGEIYWARNKDGVIDKMALLTGCSSIYMSIKCALAIADALGMKRPSWQKAKELLESTIRSRPDLFNMIKSRFSMDWYYPILCGAVCGDEAKKRIDHFWDRFVVPDWGVRCVSDRPWVTMAETSELILSLAAMGDDTRAKTIFSWLGDKRYPEGSYWMGVTFPDSVIWPEEKTAWTSAAVLMAWDALNGVTPAAKLFNHRYWQER
ncbi:MAG: phenyltransferase domain-containing protein [Deltaproteobacteria bacterium]|nr:phenyltransferase domain-containing protein [Deltaproteobacteria bacterium]